MQTHRNRESCRSSELWKTKYPNWKYIFFSDEDCRVFLKTYFSDRVLRIFDILIFGAAKADLFRMCYLYIHGGFYIDSDLVPLTTLNALPFHKHLIVVQAPCNKRLYQAFVGSVSGSPLIEKTIRCIVKSVEKYHQRLRNVGFQIPSNPVLKRDLPETHRLKMRKSRVHLDAVQLTGPKIFWLAIHKNLYDSDILVLNRPRNGYTISYLQKPLMKNQQDMRIGRENYRKFPQTKILPK